MNSEPLSKLCKKIAETPRFPRKAYNVTLTRGRLRIDVSVTHGRQFGFYASGSVGSTRRSAWGKSPSDAVTNLAKYLDAILHDLRDKEFAIN